MFSCEFCEISKNTFFHKTPLVATSEALQLTEQHVVTQNYKSFEILKLLALLSNTLKNKKKVDMQHVK